MHAQYALMGQYDFLNLIEAPDEETMAKAAIMLAARGTMRTTTLPAIPVEELIAAAVRVAARARSDPPGAAAALLAEVVLVEEHRQDRSVGAAAHLVRAARARVADAFGDLEAPRPLRLRSGTGPRRACRGARRASYDRVQRSDVASDRGTHW